MNTKQVIVIRKDLKMRRGKEIAQGAHASMAFLTSRITNYVHLLPIRIFDVEEKWIKNSFRKICVKVNSEQELKDIHQKALDNGLISHLIEDSGLTEFHGVKTATCCAIGPDYDDRIDEITKHLELY